MSFGSKCLSTPLSTDTTNAVASKPTLVAVKIRFIYVTGNTDSLMFCTRSKAYSGMNMGYHWTILLNIPTGRRDTTFMHFGCNMARD